MKKGSNAPAAGGENSGGGGGYYGGYYYGEGYAGYAESAVTPSRGLKDYLVILRERIWWLVATVFVVFLAVALYTFNAPKQYTAFSTVEILRKKDLTVQFEDVVRQEVINTEDLNTQIQILNSMEIVKQVAERLKGQQLRDFMTPYEEGVNVSLRGPLSAEEILFNKREIVPQRLSLVVNIVYSHPDPKVAATVANYFAEEFIDYNRRKQVEGSLKAVDKLRSQAEQERDKIRILEQKLADLKERYGTVAFDKRQDIDVQNLVVLTERVEQDRRSYDDSKTRWEQIELARQNGTPLWELSFISTQPLITDLQGKLSVNKIQVASLSKRYRAKHPQMMAAMQELSQTEAELQVASEAAATTVRNEFDRNKSNYEVSLTRLKEKQSKMIELDRARPEFNALERDLEVSQQLYDHYYNRLQQATVQVSTEGQTARIIDRAFEPPYPSKPNIPLNLAIGLVLGVGAGVGLVVLLALLDDKVKTAFDIETVIGIPLIGIVPRISRVDVQEKARIVADNQDKHSVEAFRAIHSTLKLNEESKSAKVILTTSTIPSEGKSFVSTNLAITYANHGERTIVIDGDLRMPNVAKSLDLENKQGMLQYLAGEIPIDQAIRKNFVPNLDVLVAGGRSKSPTQVLCSDKFEQLIHELRLRYDKVIIDSPPLAPVSDALNILPMVDGMIYVIRFNMVKRKTANINVRRVRESNVPIFGAILNNINVNVAGYYYSHYYDSSYKHYYLHHEDAAARQTMLSEKGTAPKATVPDKAEKA